MKRSKTQDILDYLQKHKSGITSMQAFEKFGETRLSGKIFNLRKNGYNIISEPKKVKTRYGASALISVYKLLDNEVSDRG